MTWDIPTPTELLRKSMLLLIAVTYPMRGFSRIVPQLKELKSQDLIEILALLFIVFPHSIQGWSREI